MVSQRSSPRALIVRHARRVEELPRRPFVAAFVAAIALLVIAIGNAPGPEAHVTEVDELALQPPDEDPYSMYERNQVPVEILEFGFGTIDLHGHERLTVGAVVRNSSPTTPADVLLEVTADDSGGSPVLLDRFLIVDIPPGRDTLVGDVLAPGIAFDARLDLAVTESVEADTSRSRISDGYLPERFGLLDVEPLLSPEGHRLVYRVESDSDQDITARVDVVFRDADGTIVGGVNGEDQPSLGTDSTGRITFRPGSSVRHFNLAEGQVPEHADLTRTELGPGGVIAGG